MDFSTPINFFMYIVKGKVLSTIFHTRFASQYLVYFFDMGSLVMSFVGAAYVAVCTVYATINFDKGLFADYARTSEWANQIHVFELVIMILFMGWSLVTTILALVFAEDVWMKLDARLAEAATSTLSIETPLDWDKAIKVYVLLMLTGLTTLLSGYALGNSANELIAYYAEYDDNEKNEATEKGSTD